MSTEQIVSLLIQERDKLDRAIQALSAGVKRRGRPPGKKTTLFKLPQKSAAAIARDKAASIRMKAYWARRKAKK